MRHQVVAGLAVALLAGGRAPARADDVPAPAAPPQRLPSATPYQPGEAAATPVPGTDGGPGPLPAVPPPSKKEAYLMAKRLRPAPAARPLVRVGVPPSKVISLFNTWTHEWIAIDGNLPDAELVGRFLRCHYTNRPTAMDPKLIGTVVQAARHFAVRRVDIVSGFRHPKYNLMLRKKGREVAKDSQHTHGHAVDFRLPGIAVGALHRWAMSRRMGGVGLYLSSGFVHMDTGPVRYWGGD